MTAGTFERVALTNRAKATHYTDGTTGAGGHVVTLCGRDVLPDAAQRNVPEDDTRKSCKSCDNRRDATSVTTEADVLAPHIAAFNASMESLAVAVEARDEASATVTSTIVVAWIHAQRANVAGKEFDARVRSVGASVGKVRTMVAQCGLTADAILMAENPGHIVRTAYDRGLLRAQVERCESADKRARKYASDKRVAQRCATIHGLASDIRTKYDAGAKGTALKSFKELANDAERMADEVLDIVEGGASGTPADDTPADTLASAGKMGPDELVADIVARLVKLGAMVADGATVDTSPILDALLLIDGADING